MAEAEEIITKRLHISGLTPALRPADLSQKLGSFGTVKALDGFDKLDGLGQPRKFGYITLETTQAKLAKCASYFTLSLHTLLMQDACTLRYEPA